MTINTKIRNKDWLMVHKTIALITDKVISITNEIDTDVKTFFIVIASWKRVRTSPTLRLPKKLYGK